MPASLRVIGRFDVARANLALQQVVSRHELLNTRFVEVEGKPFLTLLAGSPANVNIDDNTGTHVNAGGNSGANVKTKNNHNPNYTGKTESDTQNSVRLQRHDISDLPSELKTASLNALMQGNANKQFDLLHDDLLTVAYVQLEPEHGILLFNMHHIVSDGWSLGVLMREFLQAYQGLELPPLPIQYIDYARWQQNQFQGDYLDTQLAYWAELMADAPSSHSLPLDYPRGEQAENATGGLHRQALSAEVVEGLREQLSTTQCTLFMFMQAALALHVGRISHEHDVVMGAPVAGREQHQVESLIGLFLNTQLFRTAFNDNPSWTQLLAKTKAQHLASNAFNQVPFESIVEKLNPVRDLHQSPLFQILINYNNTEALQTQVTDANGDVCHFETIKAQAQPNKYDITLYIEGDVQSGIELIWSYNPAIFKASTIAFYANEFNHLISQLLQAPETPVLDHAWHHSPSWDAVQVPSVSQESPQFIELIEAQAQQRPDAMALTFKQVSLSYRQLLTQVNQLANELTAQGVVAGQRVAILTTRNEKRVIAILATLKLGACYVPLSQELPPARVAYMLSAANADVLITDNDSVSAVTAQPDLIAPPCCVVLDDAETAQRIALQPHTCEVATVHANSEAHIIYTSGSTGKPKGVAGTFAATQNRIQWMLNRYPYAEQENVAHITSMAFIRGVWELLVPLCGGAHLHLCDRDIVKDTAQLWQWIQNQQIHRMVTAPSLMKALCDLANDDVNLGHATMPLNYWFVSGEPLLQAHADAVLKAFGHVRLFNLYGSTEVMSDVLVKEQNRQPNSLQESDSAAGASHWVSVGKPIDNLNVFIRGQNGLPLPHKVIGEIAVCGAGLSNGYISSRQKQVYLSNEAFEDTPVGRVYRTGDLGFMHENGDIECLGRADDQIKIRGYRVEPGEITTLLNQQPEVKTCYVRVAKLKDINLNRHDAFANEDYTLVAYVVPHDAPDAASSTLLPTLKQRVASALPAYMHPAFYVFLPDLPLRPNGKVDRQALPQPDIAAIQQDKVAPANAIETEIAAMWAALLQVPEADIGVTSSFFDLGGHSLLATRLMKKLEEGYQLSLSYKEFFENNTIRYLAQRVEKARRMKDVLNQSKPENNKKNNKLVL